MKVYLLELKFYYENEEDEETKNEVYSSLERAVEEGKYFLEQERRKWGEFEICHFYVTKIDLEYAENFERLETQKIWSELEMEYLKHPPTHITYSYDDNRKVSL